MQTDHQKKDTLGYSMKEWKQPPQQPWKSVLEAAIIRQMESIGRNFL